MDLVRGFGDRRLCEFETGLRPSSGGARACLENRIRARPNEPPPHKSKEEIISEARSYFDSERFWEAHETLEALWRVSSGDEKLLLQGLILVCAAFVHHQKDEEETGQSVLRRASRQLNWPQSSYEEMDLERLRRRVQKILATRRFQVFRI